MDTAFFTDKLRSGLSVQSQVANMDCEYPLD